MLILELRLVIGKGLVSISILGFVHVWLYVRIMLELGLGLECDLTLLTELCDYYIYCWGYC